MIVKGSFDLNVDFKKK